MRKISLCVAMLCLIPGLALAAPSIQLQVTPTFIDEGNKVIPYSVTCASISWTTLVSSDTISRSVLYEALSTNSTAICIATMTTTAYACQDSTPGMELTPGSTLSDYTKVAWYCRSRQTSGAADTRGVLKGRRSRDSGDYGYIAQ